MLAPTKKKRSRVAAVLSITAPLPSITISLLIAGRALGPYHQLLAAVKV